MANTPLSRRSFLRHIPVAATAAGALVATGSVAVAALPTDLVTAFYGWKDACKAKSAALVALNTAQAAQPGRTLFVDHPARSAWIDADDAATQTQFELLRLLEQLI